MSFLAPHYLFAFLLVLPLIAVFLLKVRPHRKFTSQFFLWEQAFKEKRSTALFKRLRDIFSLLILLLALTALVLAISRPRLFSHQDKDLLLVLDVSASMGEDYRGSSRLDLAKAEARARIRSLGMDQSAILATLAKDLRLVVHRSTYPQDLLDGLADLRPQYEPLNAKHLSDMVSQPNFADHFQMVLISDGCLDPATLPPACELMSVGEGSNNCGITAFDIAWIPGLPHQAEIFIEWTSTFEEPVELDLRIRYGENNNLQKILTLSLEEKKQGHERIPLSKAEPGVWSLHLNDEQGMQFDNTVYAVLRDRKPVRVAIQGGGAALLETCVKAFSHTEPGIILDTANPEVLIYPSLAGLAPESVDHTPTIVFNPQGSSPLWTATGTERIEARVVIPRIKDHPYLRYLEVGSLEMGGVLPLKAPEHAVVILKTPEGIPLLYSLQAGEREYCVVNADPAASELFLSTSFPILVYTLARHHAKRTVLVPPYWTPSEEHLWASQAPFWKTQAGSIFSTQDLFAQGGAHPGLYIPLSEAKLTGTIPGGESAVSFMQASESRDIQQPSTNFSPSASFWSLERILLWSGLILLLAEAIFYHRRWVG
jgi:hypothetical protein